MSKIIAGCEFDARDWARRQQEKRLSAIRRRRRAAIEELRNETLEPEIIEGENNAEY